jgi:hypothetical protein
MMQLEEAIKLHAGRHDQPGWAELKKAWQLEDQALHSKTVEEWANFKKLATDQYVAAFHKIVDAQKCLCTGLCPGGAACKNYEGSKKKCPICRGPSSKCRPRHLMGMSCA